MRVELSVITRKTLLFKDFSRCLSSDFSSRVKARLSWCTLNYKILDTYLGIYLPSGMFIYKVLQGSVWVLTPLKLRACYIIVRVEGA
jgi:hypothetical protein